jgi:hypothetical protein
MAAAAKLTKTRMVERKSAIDPDTISRLKLTDGHVRVLIPG